MRRTYYRYSLNSGAKKYPTRAWVAIRSAQRAAAAIIALFLVVGLNLHNPLGNARNASVVQHVPGQDYQICDLQSQYLTSPWTYHALASGSQDYTAAQYEALSGYGTTLPPLPSYISNQVSTTTAAIIYAPGSTDISQPAYMRPNTPIMNFYEGGAYGELASQTISGDEFIGGSAPGYPEPQFNSNGGAGGIDAGNDSWNYSGGATTLSATANAGDTTVTTATPLAGFSSRITFSDGATYGIASTSGTSTTLSSPLASSESSGGTVWANSTPPIAEVSTGAAQGATSLTLASSSVPLVKWGKVIIGDDAYTITSVSGNQSGYTVGVAGLDKAVAANTPIYYAITAGNVTVEYLDISNDLHTTTGTINMGVGWTVEHNKVHDSYRNPSEGVALYGGDEATIEYNCFSKMGSSGAGGAGTNEIFDYNEVYQSGYEGDPGCGCTGDKWWGTLNADIVDNAFIEVGIGAGSDTPAIWFDNGNTGMLVEGNYFYRNAGSAIMNETGFNMKIDDNLFLDNGWGDGTGMASNSDGAVNLNSSGGMNIPGSRFENQILVSNNQFINNWMGVNMWQSTQRSCLSSGEGWPIDSAYCSGGFPTTASTAAGGQYYFSHMGDSSHFGTLAVGQSASSGSSTLYVTGAEAINDQVGFADPASTTTGDTTNVTTFGGSGTVTVASTTGFPSSGQLRVGTSAAAEDGGGFTGAVLSYAGKTGTTFTGVSFVRGAGALVGPVIQVQPYKVTAETCYANQCALTISPALASSVTANTTVTNAGTCSLFATSTALPSGPLAPSGVSYWDGCQWQIRNISVTGNTFRFQPSFIASTAPPAGSNPTTVCNNTNDQACGTNFMAFQSGGEAPYVDFTGGNAMMSSSSFTGCPDWDPGCSSDPLANLNALSSPPGAQANNGEAPGNNVWSSNTYIGPWFWNDVYSYSGCNPLPIDPANSNAMPNSDCGDIGFSKWQSAWQQDSGSTFNPMAVTIGNLSDSQTIHGASQTVTAYEDTQSGNTISSSLLVGTTTDSTVSNLSSSPHDFTLNTLNHHDGSYTIKVSATDSGNNTGNDTVPVIIDNGDFNGDNHVNISDLAIMASHWGQTDGNYSHGNITGQSKINISDLAVLANNWGYSH